MALSNKENNAISTARRAKHPQHRSISAGRYVRALSGRKLDNREVFVQTPEQASANTAPALSNAALTCPHLSSARQTITTKSSKIKL